MTKALEDQFAEWYANSDQVVVSFPRLTSGNGEMIIGINRNRDVFFGIEHIRRFGRRSVTVLHMSYEEFSEVIPWIVRVKVSYLEKILEDNDE